ncbi:MAG: PEP-CTERM sorting domain-containing protein [Candidatus Nealsonbacteria bacterium]|nr:PEP-CTERM sorting domain-containing protein [Candidatus Nealsonbacteria bacterium]
MKRLVVCLAVIVWVSGVACADPSASYDLRDVGYDTSVKNQTGGTCWAHGSMAAMESNLLRTGRWAQYVGEGLESDAKPNLNEYHLDWWNGFNWHNNDDTTPAQQNGNGLEPHQGGDYRVTTAYMARGDGAVSKDDEPGERDDQWYYTVPARGAGNNPYRARDVEWYTVGEGLANINTVKNVIVDHGAVGTCLFWGGGYYSGGTHYQPPSDGNDPNHSVTIIGWDDNQATQAPQDGAWLCKNSWGGGWNGDGHFWISYYDKHAGQHPEMGAVSFQNVELDQYTEIYSHDYHGWRDTLTDVDTAFNAFTATSDDPLNSVGFYTAQDDVDFTIKVYDDFDQGGNGTLETELASKSGTIGVTGYHTIDLDGLVDLALGDDFYIYLELSDGGQPIDRTSTVPVLLGAPAVTDNSIVSDALSGESYYLDGTDWADLHDLYLYGDDVQRVVTGSANFCIQGYSVVVPEPGTIMMLLGAALLGLGLRALTVYRRRR